MNLHQAYETVVSANPAARPDLGAFVAVLDPEVPYRCYGDAAVSAVSSFLDAAGLAGAYSVDRSSLDGGFATFRWSDRDAIAALADLTLDNVVMAFLRPDSNPFPDTTVTIDVAPAPTAIAAGLEPVDLNECNGVFGEVLGHEAAVRPMDVLEAHMKSMSGDDTPPVFDRRGYGYTMFRYVRTDEELTPAGGFFEAPFERTVGADTTSNDPIVGYAGFSMNQANEADKTGRPVLAVFASSCVVNDVRALRFLSDRVRMLDYVRDIFEATYGCGGRYRAVVDPRTRVSVYNQAVDGTVGGSSLFRYNDQGICDGDHCPVRLQTIVYIAPAELVSPAAVDHGTPGDDPIKVVTSASEIDMGDTVSGKAITTSDLSSEWFAMTHIGGLPTSPKHSWWYQLTPEESAGNTGRAKALYSTYAEDPARTTRACCTSAKRLECRRSGDWSTRSRVTGEPCGAFVYAVAGILRMAWCKNLGCDTLDLITVKGAKAGGLHDPNRVATAVYSGVWCDDSPAVAGWTPDMPFPRLAEVTAPEDWSRFVDALPASGAMFRHAEKTNALSYYTRSVIVETNVPYDRIIECFKSTDDDAVSFSDALSMISRSAAANICLGCTDPLAGVRSDDTSARTYGFTDTVSKQTCQKGNAALMFGDIERFATIESWNIGSDVTTSFRKGADGRLYVVVSVHGQKAYFAHGLYRFVNQLTIPSAKQLLSCTSGSAVPLEYCIVPDEASFTSLACVRDYASRMLAGASGERNDMLQNGRAMRKLRLNSFWTLAYRGAFGDSVHIHSSDTGTPPRAWFERIHMAYGRDSVADRLAGRTW